MSLVIKLTFKFTNRKWFLHMMQVLTRHVAVAEKSLLAAVVSVLDDAKADSEATCEFNVDCSGGCIRRGVMICLREKGFDAAICKTQWDHSRGVPGGKCCFSY